MIIYLANYSYRRNSRPLYASLIKILESDTGIDATYALVINSIGRLGPMQVPVAVGLRKGSNLWIEE